MQTKEYRTMDAEKAKWGFGQWQQEPDKVQWKDDATGLPCLAVRNRCGNWCGYAGVSESHPWHGKGYGQEIGPCSEGCEVSEDYTYHAGHRIDSIINVHGGLTFADKCSPGEDESKGICHLPEPGEPDHVWWFGFDCGHCDDLSPAYMEKDSWLGRNTTYRDLPYVKAQVASLARQLKAQA